MSFNEQMYLKASTTIKIMNIFITSCQITKLKQFSNGFNVLSSRGHSTWIRGALCLTSSGTLF